VLKELLDKKMLDYVAMDIKTSLGDYNSVCCVDVDIKKIRESIELLKNSSIDHEFRTTFIPGLVTKDNAVKIAETLQGAKKYVIQNFREKADMIEARFKNLKPYKKEELEEIKSLVISSFKEVKIR